jgi:hypothetical protein
MAFGRVANVRRFTAVESEHAPAPLDTIPNTRERPAEQGQQSGGAAPAGLEAVGAGGAGRARPWSMWS